MFNYCKDLVRRLDYEGYLILNLLLKRGQTAKLDAMMAVKAFDAEIATISHLVKTPEAAAIRYEFWRSALKRIKENQSVDGHPVLEDLSAARLTSNQLDWLELSLNSRTEGLDRKIYTLADLDDYAQNSLVPILLCLQDLLPDRRNENEHAIDHLGKAQVAIRRLKGLSVALLSRNPSAEQFIPTSLLGLAGLNGHTIFEALNKNIDEDVQKLKDLIHTLASHSHSHLSLVNENSGRFCKLFKYTGLRYLDSLQKHNFDLLNPSIRKIGTQRDGFLPLILYFK